MYCDLTISAILEITIPTVVVRSEEEQLGSTSAFIVRLPKQREANRLEVEPRRPFPISRRASVTHFTYQVVLSFDGLQNFPSFHFRSVSIRLGTPGG